MTDRVQAFTVVLERDMREDDVQVVLNAIRMIKFVASVEPVVATADDYMARARVRADLRAEIHKAVERVFQWNALEKRNDR